MDAKAILLLIGLIGATKSAGLLRTPKVYNALITTDENLTPSRAFPVIQPTIHETGIATYPFAPFNPYRFFNPQPPVIQYEPQPNSIFKGFSQFPLRPEQPAPIPPPQMQPEPMPAMPMEPAPMPKPEEKSESAMEEQPSEPKEAATEKAEPAPSSPVPPPADQKPPIPLNQFGLPPSLVPIHSFPRGDPQLNLQPFPYNHYPLIYDPYQQFQDQYLPPFGYYPPPGFGIHPNLIPQGYPQLAAPSAPTGPSAPSAPENVAEAPAVPKPETAKAENDFENIKNASENKNKDVPDVPPPPIPSGAKATE